MANPPTEDDVLAYFTELSNWNRWGDDDQLGTLNLITSAVRKSAASLVREGRSVSCAFDIEASAGEPHTNGAQRFMVRTGLEASTPSGRGATAMEYIGLVFHGEMITHLDALSHMFWDGRGYNGMSAAGMSSVTGASNLSVQSSGQGIVTRAVLLDLAADRGVTALDPGTAVTPEDLERAEQRHGVTVRSGDAVLLRTGRRAGEAPNHAVGTPGWRADCLPWLHEREVAIIGSDWINDPLPGRYENIVVPLHYVGIVAMGLWLIDNCNLEQLSATCAELDRYEFLFTIGPLRLAGATGSPVNPIAVF